MIFTTEFCIGNEKSILTLHKSIKFRPVQNVFGMIEIYFQPIEGQGIFSSSFQLTNASKSSLYLQALIQQSKSPGSLFVIHQTLIVLIPMKSALLDILV